MDLVLWRHAEAIDLELVGDDMLRTLSPKGEKQALRMGAWLDRQLPAGTKVFSSPALRADQTARALDRKYKTSAALAAASDGSAHDTAVVAAAAESTALIDGSSMNGVRHVLSLVARVEENGLCVCVFGPPLQILYFLDP